MATLYNWAYSVLIGKKKLLALKILVDLKYILNRKRGNVELIVVFRKYKCFAGWGEVFLFFFFKTGKVIKHCSLLK